MRNILIEFWYSSSYASTLFIDNKSWIEVFKNLEHYRHINSLDLWHYWLREAVQGSLITPLYVPSYQNIADLFTKAIQLLGTIHTHWEYLQM